MRDRQTWIRIRREMYRQSLAEVQERLGNETGELRAYRQSYEKDVRRRWKKSSPTDLQTAALDHRLILLGDFHALQQSQKAHLRLLKSWSTQGRFVLAVECVSAARQKDLDQFLTGRLGEKEFLKRVRWSKSWGFPWEHYQPLFRWARQTQTPVIALNTTGPRTTLVRRDRDAARRLAQAVERWPDRQIVAIYGDLHLASDRLPKHLKKVTGLTPLRIFQNIEGPYFRLMEKALEQSVEVIRWDPHSFSVQSVPPWVKWQNYLLWLEQAVDPELSGGEGADVTDHVARSVRWLSQELQIPVQEENLSVYTSGDPDLWEKVRHSASATEAAWLERMIEDGRSFYLSKAGWGFLARPSVNHSAALAMQYIHSQAAQGAGLRFRMPEDLQRMTWIEGIAYFGSKVINPKRKTETLADIKASLSSRQAGDRGREALRLALSQKVRELMQLSGSAPKGPVFHPRRKSSWIAAAHLLGGLMGERLYQGYRRGSLSPATLRSLLQKRISDPQFHLMYFEALEIIESLPSSGRMSKMKEG